MYIDSFISYGNGKTVSNFITVPDYATDGLWIHDCYTNRNSIKKNDERTGDFENGWTAKRYSVVSKNFFVGTFGNPGGFNTFIHTNYFTNYEGHTGETEMLRYVNNATDYVDISEKCQAHVFYNTLYAW